VRAWP